MSKSGLAADGFSWEPASYCASNNPPVNPIARIKMILLFIGPPEEMRGRDTWIPGLARFYTPPDAPSKTTKENLRRLESVSDAERQNGVKLIGRRAFVELRLLRGDVALNGRIRADRPAKQAGGVARAAAEVQGDARRPLIRGANFKRSAEVPVAAWNQIANAQEQHRRGLVYRELPGSCDGIGSVAQISSVAQREALPARH